MSIKTKNPKIYRIFVNFCNKFRKNLLTKSKKGVNIINCIIMRKICRECCYVNCKKRA